ncbi:MAG: type II toxin-antitoxin system VapC family toxin [Candidatus Competibacteraceae bacterium]|nr:type II toxin-antitoxin system VapC family toxin [Candidatus Competibacteraceae bacterium]
MRYLFDSNILIYHFNNALSPLGRALLKEGLRHGAAMSVITRIECLGYPYPEEPLAKAQRLLDALVEIELDATVVARTIQLRRHRKIKIPDAIVAATALYLNLPLVTRNIRDFRGIEGLRLINPFEDTENPSDA